MLGGKGPLRDIPERVGYKHIMMGIETSEGNTHTLLRSVDGGSFNLYAGLYADELPEDNEPTLLHEQHNEKKDDNLSTFLLSLIDLNNSRIRRNVKGDTNSLSFRNIARLLVINEEEIIQQRSPLADGMGISDTANASVFRLLLTGDDDSSLVVAKEKQQEDLSRQAQIDLLNQLIKEGQTEVKNLAGPPNQLDEQLGRLHDNMQSRVEQLAITESEYKKASSDRRLTAKKLEEANNRLADVTALLDRFTLLKAHYDSDISRLQSIEEAGSLFEALGEAECPLCGASANDHNPNKVCVGDTDQVIAAARAEIEKIERRRVELQDTIGGLRKEASLFENRLPLLQSNLSELSSTIEKVIAPNLKQMRSSYQELADKRSAVREGLALYRNLSDLKDRKAALEKLTPQSDAATIAASTLPNSVADSFAQTARVMLEQWHFPDVERIYFDDKARDLVINGKARTSFGKGLRAITQAAFTISLLEFCLEQERPHPGFAVLDSPLLSYREPEHASDSASEDDDLRDTDLKDQFFSYLSSMDDDRQIIIIENTEPPKFIKSQPQTQLFSGLDEVGRAALFVEGETEA